MKIIYLHGFNSSAQSETIQRLQEIYGEELVAISYDYINADNAFNQIEDLINTIWQEDKNIILAGTSLGGFWANHFAQLHNLKCLLINPAIIPSVSVLKYIGENKNYNTGEVRTLTSVDANRFRTYELPLNKSIYRTVIIGQLDEVIDPVISAEYFSGCNVVLVNNMTHRVSINEINLVSFYLDEIKNTFVL